MEPQNIRVTIDVSAEQLDTINHLFGHYGWDFMEIHRSDTRQPVSRSVTDDDSVVRNDASSQTDSDTETNNHDDDNILHYNILQNQDEEECKYCLCKPCITNERNRQLWWEDESITPNRRNSGLRKEKYQRFWTMMFHRDAWKDPRYVAAKAVALQSDRRQRQFEWHRRDIMPKCVLSLVRGWFPNPPGVPYMGHLWD